MGDRLEEDLIEELMELRLDSSDLREDTSIVYLYSV
jgi:hypothetical protein